MPRPAVLLLLLACLLTPIACGGDEPAITPQPATVTPTASPAEPTPSATNSPTVVAEITLTQAPPATATSLAVVRDGDAGPDAVWEPSLGLPRFQEACPGAVGPDCFEALAGLEEEEGAPAAALSFFLEHEVFLVRFEESGIVDFGAVSSPIFNMGRPTAVFLNGTAPLLYLGEVVPMDWQSEPGYEMLPDFVIAWPEYSSLRDVKADDGRQTFTVALRISECRACQDLGYLVVDVSFSDGALDGTSVQPMLVDLTPTP